MDEMKILISLKNSTKRNSRVEKNSPMRNCGGGQFRDSLPRGNESTWPCRAWRVHSIFYRVMSRRNIDRVDTNVPPLSLLFFQHGNMAVTSSSYRNYAFFTRYSLLFENSPYLLLFLQNGKSTFRMAKISVDFERSRWKITVSLWSARESKDYLRFQDF